MTANNGLIDDSVSPGQVPDLLLDLYQHRGAGWYSGEPVTQTEHALQSAWLAEQAGCDDTLVTAALLHDIGHLLHELGEDCALEGLDDEHEQVAAGFLARWFPRSVTEPIRLHVPAKRYRCGTDAVYCGQLSSASQLSLQLQGGPLDAAACREFEREPHAVAALQLRDFDDEAKVVGLQTPELQHFRQSLESCLSTENS